MARAGTRMTLGGGGRDCLLGAHAVLFFESLEAVRAGFSRSALPTPAPFWGPSQETVEIVKLISTLRYDLVMFLLELYNKTANRKVEPFSEEEQYISF